jgi:hypothetical protein
VFAARIRELTDYELRVLMHPETFDTLWNEFHEELMSAAFELTGCVVNDRVVIHRHLDAYGHGL